MGNHFRTPGDEQAAPQVPQVDPVSPLHAAPSPDVQDRLFDQPVPQNTPQSMFDAPATPDALESQVFAAAQQGEAAPSPQPAANPLFSVPAPDAPAATPLSVPSPMDAPAPAVTPDQAAEVDVYKRQVYTLSDPRAVLCKRYARGLAHAKGMGEEFELIERIEKLAPQVMACLLYTSRCV